MTCGLIEIEAEYDLEAVWKSIKTTMTNCNEYILGNKPK